MTDHTTGAPAADDFDRDDDLRARLFAADPASSLSPADPTEVARFLEDVMSVDTDHRADHLTDHDHDHNAPIVTRQTGTHHRNPLTWLVAAAAVVLIAGVGFFGLVNRDGTDVPTAKDPAPGTSAGTSGTTEVAAVTELSAAPAGGIQGKCMVPNAALIAAQGVAFQGTVTSIADGVVTLTPTDVFSGKVAALVEVKAPSADMQQLIGAVGFEQGKSYLVSATDGQVTACGFSGEATPDLQKLYSQAFPG